MTTSSDQKTRRFRRGRPTLLVSFVPDQLSEAARRLWPPRDAMPTPENIDMILRTTRHDPALRLEILSWLRRTAVPRGEELFGFLGSLFAVLALTLALIKLLPWVALALAVLVGISMFWLLSKSASAVVHLGERSRHAATWLAALEDAIKAESMRRGFWWFRAHR